MNSGCANIYSELLAAGEQYRLALHAASEAIGRMAEPLELLNPLAEFESFKSHEAPDKFKAALYECVLAELFAKRAISLQTRQSLKAKAHDAGNPAPNEESLQAFAEYAREMEQAA